MSFKRGLIEIKSKLNQNILLRRNKFFNNYQKINSEHFFSNISFCKDDPSSSRKLAKKFFIDTGQRHFQILSRNNKKIIAVNEVEPDEYEALPIELPASHDALIIQLQQCSSLSEQMTILQSALSLNEKDREERIILSNKIYTMLEPFFDDFKVQLYGSSVNGFGFKGCDIDISFTTNVSKEGLMNTAHDDSDIPTIEDVLNGKISPTYISKLSLMDQLIFIHTVFLDYYKDSAVAPLFIRAYIPIVRFSFDKYNLKCDLTTGNRTALLNTKLLHIYGKYDSRVIPFLMSIRYWAKHVGLIGGGLMFNTYTVTLLGIFYLQNRSIPVLPTAETIMNSSDFMTSEHMDFKQLQQVLEKLPKSENTESLDELFREFFFYYLFFDFNKVICPLNGRAMSRDDFCADEVSKKFKMNTICVQDPIKLTHNVANLVDYKCCRKFAIEMVHVCKSLQNKTFWTPSENKWGLIALFEQDKNKLFHDLKDEQFFSFDIPLSTSQFNRIDFASKASSLVQKILNYVLLFKCEDYFQSKDINIYNDSFNNTNGELLFWIKCSSHNNTWLGRNCVQPEKSVEMDFFERERSISLSLCNRIKEDHKEKPRREYLFTCKCYVVQINNQSYLSLQFTPFGNVEFSNVLNIFLQEYLSKNLKNVLEISE